MDPSDLAVALERAFDGTPAQYRVVARQAVDLDDAGRLEADLDIALTTETVIDNLADAPANCDVAERWNWWMGALSLSHGGYRRFTVRSAGP